MKIKLTTIIFLSLGLFFLIIAPALAEDIDEPPSIQGRVERTGTSFEITDSEYLNVSLQSTEEITVLLESIPKMISLDIEASSVSDSTTLTFGNLEPNTTYYRFEDSYKNKAEFITNENGEDTFTQGLTQPHHIWIQPEDNGTVFLPEECSIYGIWDEPTLTCTLTQDLTENVEITTNNITLDCNSHSITGPGIGYGIYLRESGAVIKNCDVANFSYAVYIYFYAWGDTFIHDCTFSNNVIGLGGYSRWEMKVERCIFEENIYAITNADKEISDSTFRNNDYGLYCTERISVYSSTFTENKVALYGGRGEVKSSEIFNNDIGVKAFFEGFKLLNNTIAGNEVGVILGQYDTYSSPVEYNNIYNNLIYNLKNTGPANKSVRYNWWGTTNPCQIEEKIYDGYDDASVGIIEYSPILIGPQETNPSTTEVDRCIISGPGGIFEDTTWRLPESPYIITEDLTLFPGYTLIIEPGVEIRFSSDTKLTIRGSLLIEGVESSRITFTSTDSNTKGDWKGIYIATSLGAKATIKFVDFSYAHTAIYVECCWQGGPVDIYDSKFTNNVTALGGYAGWDMIVERCLFEDNIHAVANADKEISDSTFRNNDYGLYATERVSVYYSKFVGNQIGLYGGRGEIKFCEISNNNIGVQGFFEGFSLSKNTITNNEIGVILTQYDTFTPPVEYNNIYNNTLFNLKNSTSANKEVKYNWWGTTDEAEINAKIYDRYDDSSLGIVYYEPILTAPVEVISDLGFRADPNGFKFKNFCTKYFDEELNKDVSRTWEMFEQFFGTEATMIGDIRRYSAERFFDEKYGKYNPGQCGSCDGFVGTSLINFKHLDQPNAGPFAIPYYENLYLQDLNDDIKDAIAYQQGFQFSLEPISYVTALKEEANNSPKFFYEKIKEAIQSKESVALWIQEKPKWWEIWKESGGHALVPYRYEEELLENKGYIYVYDSNYPGDDNRKVIFDLEDDKWSYKFQKGWWIFGETWTGDAQASYQTIATVPLPMRLHKGVPPWGQEVSPFAYICGAEEAVSLLFTDQGGRRIGFPEGPFINEVPGANYITPLTQTQDKVLGFYYLPEENDYTVTLRGIDEGTADFRAFSNGLLIEITDATIHPTTIDNINIGRGEKSLTYSTNDDYKEYSATIAQELPETSRIITVDTDISVGDTTTLEITDEQTFKYINIGDTKTYDLLLEQRGAGAGQTSFLDLTIEDNDTHVIDVADWDDLENTAINAEIDEDSDGTIDRIERLQVIPRQLKEEVKINLEEAKTEDKLIDKEIDLIIEHVDNSLNSELWIDDFRLDPDHGEKVFHEEHTAVVHMEHKVKLSGKIILSVIEQAIHNLTKVDEKLSEVAISDAKNTPVKNPKFQRIVDHQIEKAEEELFRAHRELEKDRPAKAIKRFEEVWLHAQLAIKFAELNN